MEAQCNARQEFYGTARVAAIEASQLVLRSTVRVLFVNQCFCVTLLCSGVHKLVPLSLPLSRFRKIPDERCTVLFICPHFIILWFDSYEFIQWGQTLVFHPKGEKTPWVEIRPKTAFLLWEAFLRPRTHKNAPGARNREKTRFLTPFLGFL